MTLAVTVTLATCLVPVTWAAPAAPTPAVDQLTIPDELGRIIDRWLPPRHCERSEAIYRGDCFSDYVASQ